MKQAKWPLSADTQIAPPPIFYHHKTYSQDHDKIQGSGRPVSYDTIVRLREAHISMLTRMNHGHGTAKSFMSRESTIAAKLEFMEHWEALIKNYRV
jgi:hypothetical protein